MVFIESSLNKPLRFKVKVFYKASKLIPKKLPK